MYIHRQCWCNIDYNDTLSVLLLTTWTSNGFSLPVKEDQPKKELTCVHMPNGNNVVAAVVGKRMNNSSYSLNRPGAK